MALIDVTTIEDLRQERVKSYMERNLCGLENFNKAYLKLTMVTALFNHHWLLNILGVSGVYISAIVYPVYL